MGGEFLRLVQRIWDAFRPWVSKEDWFYRVLLVAFPLGMAGMGATLARKINFRPRAVTTVTGLVWLAAQGFMCWVGLGLRQFRRPGYHVLLDQAEEGRGFKDFIRDARETILITHLDDVPSEELRRLYEAFLGDWRGSLRRIVFLREGAPFQSYNWISKLDATNKKLEHRILLPEHGRYLPFSFAVIDNRKVLISLRDYEPAAEMRQERVLTHLAVIDCQITARAYAAIFAEYWREALKLTDLSIFKTEAGWRSLCRNFVSIEEVTERHRQSILDMCAKIYQKTDADRPKFFEYMHRNISRWISEQENIFLSANTTDGMVGCINLAVLPNSAAVLEGARVVRNRRNQGIGSRLASEAISKGLRKANAPLTIRCLVDSDNDDGLSFVRKKLRWNEIAVFRTVEGSARASNGVAKPRAERIEDERLEAVASYLECHRSFRGSRALILDGWRPIHVEDVRKFLNDNRAYAYIDEDSRVRGVAVARSSLSSIRDRTQEVPVLFAETGEQCKALINSIQQDPSPLAGAKELLVSFPHDLTVENALAAIGFTQERDHLDLIFEKRYAINVRVKSKELISDSVLKDFA